MKKRIKILVTAYFACIFTVFSISAGAFELSVPLYAQPNGSYWCWAVSAKMIGDYWYPNNNRTAAQAVQHIKGTLSHGAAGNYNDHIAAIKYITHDLITYKRATSGFTDTFIKNKLTANVPITVGVTLPSMGHVYVLKGYNDYFTSIYLIFNDPSGGVRRSVHYLDFMQGTTSFGTYNDHFYM